MSRHLEIVALAVEFKFVNELLIRYHTSGMPYMTGCSGGNCHVRPYPLENSGSRPLSHRQASEG
ncbi:hypothetical protein F4808DRAFT_214007 [Astrocystis sublimbata]|nr:hypothetical protein F4808DRAFT_214007 [Astrocystis sublimbata]